MSNHFHLVIYQKNMGAMTQLMRSVMTSYSRYFNHKYERTGPLFESRYKASRIDNDAYLMHISRYVHLNPQSYRRYRYSSLGAYLDYSPPEWLQPEKMLSLFDSPTQYETFVSDYEANKAFIDEAKHDLDP